MFRGVGRPGMGGRGEGGGQAMVCLLALRGGRALGRQASVRACDPELGDLSDGHLKIGCGRAAGVLDYKRVTIFKFR